MSKKHLFYVAIALALFALGAITLRTTVATSAVVSIPHDAYDEVERTRSNFSANKSTDTSYDEVERIRAKVDAAKSFDSSYDEVERIRAQVQTIHSTLPFGPGLAATYGTPNDANGATDALPFGPGWAATYGVPAHQQQGTNKNPIRSARNADLSNGAVRAPELYDPARASDLAGYWNAVSQSGGK